MFNSFNSRIESFISPTYTLAGWLSEDRKSHLSSCMDAILIKKGFPKDILRTIKTPRSLNWWSYCPYRRPYCRLGNTIKSRMLFFLSLIK